MGQKCRERGDDATDGKRRADGPHREPVARGPHTEHDSDHHQQHADDRGAWRIVGVGHVDSHGRDRQAEDDKGECLHGGSSEWFSCPQCDRGPAAEVPLLPNQASQAPLNPVPDLFLRLVGDGLAEHTADVNRHTRRIG